jgi:hypothetical protein
VTPAAAMQAAADSGDYGETHSSTAWHGPPNVGGKTAMRIVCTHPVTNLADGWQGGAAVQLIYKPLQAGCSTAS